MRYAATDARRDFAFGPFRLASAAESSAMRSFIGTAKGSRPSVVRYSPFCGGIGASVTGFERVVAAAWARRKASSTRPFIAASVV